MKLPPTNCPMCNALERFARKERRIGDLIYVYTRCGTCRTEFSIEAYNVEEERQRERAHLERIRKARARHGLRYARRS